MAVAYYYEVGARERLFRCAEYFTEVGRTNAFRVIEERVDKNPLPRR